MSWPICTDECGCYKRGADDAMRPARKLAAGTAWMKSRCYSPVPYPFVDCYCLMVKGHDGEHSPFYQGDNEADKL